jgi:hypothetical protein
MAVEALAGPAAPVRSTPDLMQRLPDAVGVFMLAALILWLPAGLTAPVASDQSIFIWAARAVMDGGLPIIDAFDVKSPLAVWSYAGAMTLFGDTVAATRIGHLCVFAATYATLAWMVRDMPGGLRAVALAGLAGLLASGVSFMATAQPDVWAGLLTLLACAVLGLSRGERPLLACAIAAALLAAATAFKLVFAATGLMLIAHLALSPPGGRLARLGAMLAGGGAVIGMVLAPYALAGRLDELWSMHVGFLLDVHAGRGVDPIRLLVLAVGVAASWGEPWWLAVRVLAIAGLVVLWRTGRRPLSLLLLAGWFAHGLIVIAQGKGFSYHVAPQLLFETAAAGVALSALAAGALKPRAQAVVGVCAALLLGGLAAPLDEGARHLASRIAPDRFAPPVRIYEGVDMRRDEPAIACVRALTAPDDRIHLFSFHAILYARTGRPGASAMGLSYPLVAGGPAWRAAAQARLMDDLARNPPRLIFVDEADDQILLPGGSARLLPTVDGLADLIARDYRLACTTPTGRGYLRRETGNTREPIQLTSQQAR